MITGRRHLGLGRAAAVGLCAALVLAAVACEADPGDDPNATNSPQATAEPTESPTRAPTPVRTVLANTSTSVPPSPTATAEPTATAIPRPELVVNEADFEMGAEGSPFMDLLSRVPDTEQTRAEVRMQNIAAIHALLGIELLEPPVTKESIEDHFADMARKAEPAGLSDLGTLPVLPTWPEEMRRYLTTWNPYPHVHISQFMAEQSIFAGRPHNQFEIALGEGFDPDATDAALAQCDCDQPDINEYGGMTYYSWGEESQGTIDRRFAPPIYDHVGRGPRLLVGDGFAAYSVHNYPIEGAIDAMQGNVPSLADSEAHAGAVRWLEGMGTIGTVSMYEGWLQIDEIMDIFEAETVTEEGPSGQRMIVERTAESARQALTKAPLLLPFSLAAGAIGYDGERPFTGFVLAHDDEVAAAENLERLTARIRDGAIDGRLVDGEYKETPVSDVIAQADLMQEGRFVIARIYQHEPHQNFYTGFTAHGWMPGPSDSEFQLLIHE